MVHVSCKKKKTLLHHSSQALVRFNYARDMKVGQGLSASE